MSSDEPLECGACGRHVREEDEFCVSCGALFVEDIYCINHPETIAEGVCPVCRNAFCSRCGESADNIFLCSEHNHFEIIEAMARVLGSSDPLLVSNGERALKEAGLHPFVFSRKASPLHLGGSDYTLFRASGDYNGHIVNEFKLMVPLSETLMALYVLDEAGISEE